MSCGLLVKVIAKTAFISETAHRLAPRNTLLKTNEILAKQKSRKLLLASVRNHKLKSRKKNARRHLAWPRPTLLSNVEKCGESSKTTYWLETQTAITISKLDMI